MGSAPGDLLVKRALKNLRGKRCWHVRCGRNVGRSFAIYLGKKVKKMEPPSRSPLLRRLAARGPKILRENAPEYELLVWCSWRLSKTVGGVVLMSDDCEGGDDTIKKQLRNRLSIRKLLKGATIKELKIISRFYDLKIVFSNGCQLDVLCNRGKAKPKIDPSYSPIASNWEIFVPGDFVVGV